MDKKEYIERKEVYSEINKLPLTEDAAMEILWAIDDIPTADVAPVVHGYWIKTANTWTHDYDEANKQVYRCFFLRVGANPIAGNGVRIMICCHRYILHLLVAVVGSAIISL